MGLDAVEIVLRCEEVFGITIADEDGEQAVTVGGLYRLVCAELKLSTELRFPVPDTLPALPPNPHERQQVIQLQLNPQTPPQWNPENVWETVIAILCDQMQLQPSEVWYDARFGADLHID